MAARSCVSGSTGRCSTRRAAVDEGGEEQDAEERRGAGEHPTGEASAAAQARVSMRPPRRAVGGRLLPRPERPGMMAGGGGREARPRLQDRHLDAAAGAAAEAARVEVAARRAARPGSGSRPPARSGRGGPRDRGPAPPRAAPGCRGGPACSKMSALAPSSTMRPRYITATRSEMWRTTERSCAMNR